MTDLQGKDAAGLVGRLPAFHREGAGGFPALAGCLEESLARISCAARSWMPSGAILHRRPAEGGGPACVLAATARGLSRLLERGGIRPRILSGAAVRPTEKGGELEMVPSPSRTAVVLWPEGCDPELARSSRVPETMVPAGSRIQMVLLGGPPPRSGVRGERFRGELLD
jgi:hypothetical protein